jgi:cytochrome c
MTAGSVLDPPPDPRGRVAAGRRVGSKLPILALCAAAPVLANDVPVLTIHVGGNETFAWDREPIRYIVVASDTEDGDSLAGTLDPYSVAVEFRFLADGFVDYAPAPADPRAVIGATRGRELVEGDDCLLCHSERATGPTAVPTYAAIAEKFQGNLSVAPALAANIVNGSQGIWGTMLMPAHAVAMDEANAMALYVLSFARSAPARELLPISGTAAADVWQQVEPGPLGPTFAGRYVLTGAYTDRGDGAETAATGTAMHAFRSPNVLATELDERSGFVATESNGVSVLVAGEEGASARLAGIDLSGIRNVSLVTLGSARRWPGARIELRLDAPDGELLGAIEVEHTERQPDFRRSAIRIMPRDDRHDLYVVVDPSGSLALGAICFECSY